MVFIAFLEGIAGQGGDIDAIFEIEAQVVDDVINEHTRSDIAGGHASKPHSPSRGSLTSPKTPRKETSEHQTPPASPPIRVPQAVNSPGQMSDFPSSASTHGDASPQTRGRMLQSSDDTQSEDLSGNGSARLELFRQDSEHSNSNSNRQNLPTILRTPPPPRPALPPRHVRTRRDSQALQSFRMAALTTANNNSNGSNSSVAWSTADPFALNPPMSSISMNDGSGFTSSPLAQLYGTVVVEDGSLPRNTGGIGLGVPPQARRLRTMSAGAALLESGPRGHRRLSSNHSTRPTMFGHTEDEFPETVQEAEDDMEEQPGEAAQSAEMLRMLAKMEDRQERIEAQMKEILDVLSRRR